MSILTRKAVSSTNPRLKRKPILFKLLCELPWAIGRKSNGSTKEHTMKQPQIEIIPVRGAVRFDAPVTLDVLVRITPPAPEVQVQRPALNLGLVLDRSGSMGGQNKIGFAREAAIYAVQQLLPTD